MLGRITTQLHSYPTPFIGRNDDIAAIAQRLADPHCRLLTLVGPGGIGKTRLAIEAARRLAEMSAPAGSGQPLFIDGIFYVDLQPIAMSEVLVATIASALDMLLSGPQDPRDQLLNYLSTRTTLLLLDNFEQLLDAVDLLADILSIAPGVKLLITSREALNMAEEWLWRMIGLAVPDHQSEASIESYSAVQLFAERARRTHQDFTLIGQEIAVTRICHLVDGMPLALELAAGWTNALSCAEIAYEIQRGLDVLTTHLRNAPERHRSMQAVFDRSWQLLTDAERKAFPYLSVFRGGFRREAAEQVSGASLVVLSGLVDKSFLRLSASGRYEIQELTRQYGEEQLDTLPGAKVDAQNRHCDYYAGFLHQRQAALRGPGQSAALDEIDDELDNIRESWQWAVEHDRGPDIQRSVHSLYVYCQIRAQALEGQRLFDLAVKRFAHEDNALVAYLLLARNSMAELNGRWHVGAGKDMGQVIRALRLAYAFWTTDEIAIHIYMYIRFREELEIEGHWRLEQVYRDFLERFRTHSQLWGATFMLYCLGVSAGEDRNLAEAEKYYRDSLDGFLRLGDRWASCWSNMGLAQVYELSERYHESLQQWQIHQDICAQVGDRGGVVFAWAQKARVAWRLQDFHTAKIYIAQAIKSRIDSGSDFFHLHQVFLSLNAVLVSENRHERAAEMLSFLWQQADRAQGSGIMAEAEQRLDTLSTQLPAVLYQQAIERGKTLQLGTILEQLLDELADDALTPAPVPMTGPPYQILRDPLTERELEVLHLLAAGRSNREIAETLFLALGTVKWYISEIYSKLAVASRTQAIARAGELNLLS